MCAFSLIWCARKDEDVVEVINDKETLDYINEDYPPPKNSYDDPQVSPFETYVVYNHDSMGNYYLKTPSDLDENNPLRDPFRVVKVEGDQYLTQKSKDSLPPRSSDVLPPEPEPSAIEKAGEVAPSGQPVQQGVPAPVPPVVQGQPVQGVPVPPVVPPVPVPVQPAVQPVVQPVAPAVAPVVQGLPPAPEVQPVPVPAAAQAVQSGVIQATKGGKTKKKRKRTKKRKTTKKRKQTKKRKTTKKK